MKKLTTTYNLKKLKKTLTIINALNIFDVKVFDETSKQTKLATKTDIAGFIAKKYFDAKLKNIILI